MSRGVRVAGAVAAFDAAAVLVLVTGGLIAGYDDELLTLNSYANVVVSLMLPALGVLLVRHAPTNRLGPLILALGTASMLTFFCYFYAEYGLVQHPGALPGALTVAWVSQWEWVFVPTLFLAVLLCFPSGRPLWRWTVWLPVGAWLALWLSMAFESGPFENHPSRNNPYGWDTPVRDVVYWTGQGLLAVALLAALVTVVVRFRRGDEQERRQLRWMVGSVGLLFVSIAVPTSGVLAPAGVALSLLSLPLVIVAMGIALVRHRVHGVQVVLRRSIVFGLLSVLLLLAYVAVVGACTAALGASADRSATLAGAGIVAVLAAPLRTRLQASVDKLVYGDRGDPYRAVTELGRRAEAAGTPEELLEEMVEVVAAAVRSPRAVVELRGDDPVVLDGPTHRVSLGDAGALVVAQRTARDPFGPRDVALLEDLARHVSVAAGAALLWRDLRRSRERLVTAREEERRRIRRDLHDGLGPALAGITFGLEAVRNTYGDPQGLLADLKAEVSSCLSDVRRLVYDLRPPALDQFGLVVALEQFAARLSEGGLAVGVTSPDLPSLPAAVEVAAYRIATEALTNAARHSGGRSSHVTLDLGDQSLRVEVTDDGRGVTGPPGVGLTAMAERAAELGGELSIAGSSVVAVLPLREPA